MMSALRSSRHSAGMAGRTTSSAASAISKKSMPVLTPILSNTPIERLDRGVARAGAEAAACCRRSAWRPPGRPRTELATPRPRFSWPWKPTWASSPSSATSAATRSADTVEDQRAGRVDDVDALAAGVGHDPGLRGQHLRRLVCAIIRKPTVSRPSSRASPKCWIETSASVQWVAIRQIERAVVRRLVDVFLGAHAGQHQEGDLGLLGGLRGELDQLLLGGLGEAVVERRAAEAVAVGHLDDRHARGVERGDDRAGPRPW